MAVYMLRPDVACGRKPYRELETASHSVRDQKWYEWLAIPPSDSYRWDWYPKIGNLNSLVLWNQVHVPVVLVHGELDQLVPVDERLAKIEASLDAAKTAYTAIIAPAAQHNLTVRPGDGRPFFWWKSAPGLIDLVVAWVQQRTSERGPSSYTDNRGVKWIEAILTHGSHVLALFRIAAQRGSHYTA